MSRRATVEPTPRAVAAAELEAARAEITAIEQANEPTEVRLARAVEQLDTAIQTVGGDNPAALKARREIAVVQEDVLRGRQRLEAAKRRVRASRDRLASEMRAIALAHENVKRQAQRVERAREVIAAAEKVVEQKREALTREEAMLAHFEGELSKLTGGEPADREGE